MNFLVIKICSLSFLSQGFRETIPLDKPGCVESADSFLSIFYASSLENAQNDNKQCKHLWENVQNEITGIIRKRLMQLSLHGESGKFTVVGFIGLFSYYA